MRLFQKTNQYLIENHPLTWHSKFLQLLLAGVLFWAVSYLCGYSLVNLEVLREQNLGKYYSRSNFISFHVIYCLIVVCIWAIFFYKNNAVKSFYPLQRFYFTKLFLQLLMAFFLLISAYYPFTWGAYAKARAILPETEVEKDIEKMNIGSVFTVDNKENYNVLNRPEISSKNWDYLTYDFPDKTWGNYNYYYAPELVNETYANPGKYNTDSVAEANATVINGSKYFFFTSEIKYETKDSCSVNSFITDFHRPDVTGYHEYALYNFNQTHFSYRNPANERRFYSKILPGIRTWIANDRRDAIEGAVSGLIDVCNKYGINYDLDPVLIAKYFQAKDYIMLEDFVAGNDYSYIDKVQYREREPEEFAILEKYAAPGTEVTVEDLFLFITAIENQEYMHYGRTTFENVLFNYRTAYSKELQDRYNCLVLVVIAFSMAGLFLLFEFANIVSLLISIPVGGVLVILVSAILIYIQLRRRDISSYMDHHFIEKISAVTVFSVALLILLTTVFGLYRKGFSKKILNILVNFSYVLAPMIITIFVVMVHIISGHYEQHKCGIVYKMDFKALLDPYLLLLYAFTGFLAFLPVIRKWRAREE